VTTHGTQRTWVSHLRREAASLTVAFAQGGVYFSHKLLHALRSSLSVSKWSHGFSAFHSANSAPARSAGMVGSSAKWYGMNCSDTCAVKEW
jgi:hypothetical protein